MMWFWVGYISIGLWILMPGIVHVWETEQDHITIKVLGTALAVLAWPLVFVSNRNV